MKGLLYKDFIHLRKFLLAGLFLIVFSLVGIWIFLNRLGEKDFCYGFIVSASTHWLTLITAYFAFQRDERNKWNVYVLSFPVDKRLLVRSRYLFLSCILLTGNLLGFSLWIFLWFYSGSISRALRDDRSHASAAQCLFTGSLPKGLAGRDLDSGSLLYFIECF